MPASDTGQCKSALIEDKKGAHRTLYINDRAVETAGRVVHRTHCAVTDDRSRCADCTHTHTASQSSAHHRPHETLRTSSTGCRCRAHFCSHASHSTHRSTPAARNWAGALNRAPRPSSLRATQLTSPAASTDRADRRRSQSPIRPSPSFHPFPQSGDGAVTPAAAVG